MSARSAIVFFFLLRCAASFAPVARLNLPKLCEPTLVTTWGPCMRSDHGVELHLFRRIFRRRKGNKDPIGSNDDEDNDANKSTQNEKAEDTDSQLDSRVPFFPQAPEKEEADEKDEEGIDAALLLSTAQDDAPLIQNDSSTVSAQIPQHSVAAMTGHAEKREMTASRNMALEEAKALRAHAELIRLEAQKMEAALTMEKISKLEKELNGKANDPERIKFVKVQIDSLAKKLQGEENVLAVTEKNTSTTSKPKPVSSCNDKTTAGISSKPDDSTVLFKVMEPLSQQEINDRVQKFEQAPAFIKEVVVKAVGLSFRAGAINSTALILRLHQDEFQFLTTLGDSQKSSPNFTNEEINEQLDRLKNVPSFIKNLYGTDANNDTAIALSLLEEEWKEKQTEKGNKGLSVFGQKDDTDMPSKKVGGAGAGLFGLFGNNNDEESDTEKMVSSMLPQSTRKEGATPTETQIKMFMAEVLAKNNVWAASGPPEPVPGGYVIRGTSKYKKGDELIAALDANLAKSRVKVLACYMYDITPVTEDQQTGGERPPVLFVTGANVSRDPIGVQSTLVSAFGIGTTWYASLYPYLLNNKIMTVADEQLALADASMPFNLNFLWDMAGSLFFPFLGIILAHELGHRAAAAANKMQITIPTLVPSFVSGITSSVTALKTPPKNSRTLFDFAVAGPLTGIAVSLLLLVYGLDATTHMDAASYANLPALPLGFLRQSSLGGGVVEAVLGAGVLDISTSSSSNIAMHPFAIAGYLGLVVNALSLVPYGRTDGGRIALTLFGRAGSQFVSLIASIIVFAEGLFSSDLLLFYFSFIIFFQSELEIPQRNEVDGLDFGRVLLATAVGCLMLLALIPM